MFQLPHWVLSDKFPAFYDTVSGSGIEQTAKVYGAMREFIKDYNDFVDKFNKSLEEFELKTQAEQDCFKSCITQLMETYIKSIDITIDKQNLKIEDAVSYMKDNIQATTRDYLNSAMDAGTIAVYQTYDEATESLNLVVTGEV